MNCSLAETHRLSIFYNGNITSRGFSGKNEIIRFWYCTLCPNTIRFLGNVIHIIEH